MQHETMSKLPILVLDDVGACGRERERERERERVGNPRLRVDRGGPCWDLQKRVGGLAKTMLSTNWIENTQTETEHDKLMSRTSLWIG